MPSWLFLRCQSIISMRIVQSFHNTSHRFCPHKRVIGPGRRCPQCEEASCINTDNSGPAVQTTVRVGSGCLEEAPQGGRFEKNSGVAEDSEVTDKEVVTALKTALDHSSTLVGSTTPAFAGPATAARDPDCEHSDSDEELARLSSKKITAGKKLGCFAGVLGILGRKPTGTR